MIEKGYQIIRCQISIHIDKNQKKEKEIRWYPIEKYQRYYKISRETWKKDLPSWHTPECALWRFIGITSIAAEHGKTFAEISPSTFFWQRRLARFWYWGERGIDRDLNQAARVLQENAEAPDARDWDSLEYGLVLLKGQGTGKDVTSARKHFKRASNMVLFFSEISFHRCNLLSSTCFYISG